MRKFQCDACAERFPSSTKHGDPDIAVFCGFCYIRCGNCYAYNEQCSECLKSAELELATALDEECGEGLGHVGNQRWE